MTEESTTEVEAWGPERGSVVPLALLALLVFSRLAPDAGRSTALGLEACLPLPHNPAALCLRLIIPLLDDPGGALCSVLKGALVASKVEILLQIQIQTPPHN